MSIKGKYDFPGIKKAGVAGISAALASTGWGAGALASPIWGPLLRGALGFLVEWLANKGLIFVNTGIEMIDGQFDQKKFDVAMERGIEQAKTKGLTDAQKKKIDQDVMDAFDEFADLGLAD